ncbi:MAG TPA: lysozyme [Pseudoalteromonas shioyasakiensis]|nr:lysozyme [Pseudoalteromonas shioyasakiensis]|tara:strand:+ start:6309 stop:6779 length:471 start_codon:yes stop_codon:yes gene_type:complete
MHDLNRLCCSVLAYEEGFRSRAYHCSEGYPTIGYGFKLGPRNAALNFYKFSISKEVATVWLSELVDKVIADMHRCPTIRAAWDVSNDARKTILVSMAYQMGIDGLSSFSGFLSAARSRNWELASNEMLDSLWNRQTPKRAKRHAEQFKTGSFNSLY